MALRRAGSRPGAEKPHPRHPVVACEEPRLDRFFLADGTNPGPRRISAGEGLTIPPAAMLAPVFVPDASFRSPRR